MAVPSTELARSQSSCTDGQRLARRSEAPPRAAAPGLRLSALDGQAGITDLRLLIQSELRELLGLQAHGLEGELGKEGAAACTTPGLQPSGGAAAPQVEGGPRVAVQAPPLGLPAAEDSAQPGPGHVAAPGEVGVRLRAATRPQQFVREELLRVLSGRGGADGQPRWGSEVGAEEAGGRLERPEAPAPGPASV